MLTVSSADLLPHVLTTVIPSFFGKQYRTFIENEFYTHLLECILKINIKTFTFHQLLFTKIYTLRSHKPVYFCFFCLQSIGSLADAYVNQSSASSLAWHNYLPSLLLRFLHNTLENFKSS